MKILHVTNGIEWSGGMEQITLLISGLKEENHINFLACPPPSKLIGRLSPLGIPIRKISMRQDYDLIAAWKIRGFVKETNPDVVHTHHATAHAVTLLALTGMGSPPLVVSRRVSFPPRRNPFSIWKYGSSRIKAYTVVSQAVKETLASRGVKAEKIHVVYSALDPVRFSKSNVGQKVRVPLGFGEKGKVVGKLANYSPWKGHRVFLQAAKICLASDPALKFILIGNHTEELGPYVHSLGIGHSVKILGYRTDVPELLSAMNVSVNAAIQGEGLSGAMRESLMLGVPVVATDVSGNREIVRHNQTGILVPPGNAQALAQAILKSLASPGDAKAMAEKGRQWVLQNATAEKMTADTLRVYETVIRA